MPRPRKKPLTDAQVEALDRDDNGEAGGSLPKLGEHELAAICAEAWDAYDRFPDEVVRFDSLGRRWGFLRDQDAGHSVLRLRVSRLDAEQSDTISTAILASDMGRPMIADVVGRLAEAVT